PRGCSVVASLAWTPGRSGIGASWVDEKAGSLWCLLASYSNGGRRRAENARGSPSPRWAGEGKNCQPPAVLVTGRNHSRSKMYCDTVAPDPLIRIAEESQSRRQGKEYRPARLI